MKIFLSYASEDTQWAEKLVAALKSDGVAVSNSGEITGLDDDSEESFRQSMLSADLIVPVITEHSSHSPRALFEWGAISVMKKLVLLLFVPKWGKQSKTPLSWAARPSIEVTSPQEAAEQIKQFASKQLAGV